MLADPWGHKKSRELYNEKAKSRKAFLSLLGKKQSGEAIDEGDTLRAFASVLKTAVKHITHMKLYENGSPTLHDLHLPQAGVGWQCGLDGSGGWMAVEVESQWILKVRKGLSKGAVMERMKRRLVPIADSHCDSNYKWIGNG